MTLQLVWDCSAVPELGRGCTCTGKAKLGRKVLSIKLGVS